jgi:probable phosphoglycerate mutase
VTAERLIVWRHGRTSWNAAGLYQGQADIGLDDLGRRQADAAAAVLAELKPDAIVASDLSRAADTAGALAAITSLTVGYDRRLREIDVGSWEGKTVEQAAETDPDLVAGLAAGQDVRRSPTGETTSEVANRVAHALTDIIDAAEDGSTVVVTMHGLAGRVGIGRFLDVDPDRLGGLRNCAWVVLDRHPRGHWYIGAYNAQAEIAGEDSDATP